MTVLITYYRSTQRCDSSGDIHWQIGDTTVTPLARAQTADRRPHQELSTQFIQLIKAMAEATRKQGQASTRNANGEGVRRPGRNQDKREARTHNGISGEERMKAGHSSETDKMDLCQGSTKACKEPKN